MDIEFPWFFVPGLTSYKKLVHYFLFKKVILKIGSLAAILYENNNIFFSILKFMLNKSSEKNSHFLYYTSDEKPSKLDLFSAARVVLPLKIVSGNFS